MVGIRCPLQVNYLVGGKRNAVSSLVLRRVGIYEHGHTASGPEGPVHNNLGIGKISHLSSPVFFASYPLSIQKVQL